MNFSLQQLAFASVGSAALAIIAHRFFFNTSATSDKILKVQPAPNPETEVKWWAIF